MKRTITATVTRTNYVWNETVEVHFQHGLSLEFPIAGAPTAGQLVTIDLAWGDDYLAPVVPITEPTRKGLRNMRNAG